MPNLLEDGLKTVFFEALDATIGDYERVATIVGSESDQEDYAWLGAVPAIREFTDERMPLGLLEHDYAIRNKTWESSIAVERAAIEDDKYGQIKLRVMSLAREAKRHMDELVFTLLRNGFAATCYDGQYVLRRRPRRGRVRHAVQQGHFGPVRDRAPGRDHRDDEVSRTTAASCWAWCPTCWSCRPTCSGPRWNCWSPPTGPARAR